MSNLIVLQVLYEIIQQIVSVFVHALRSYTG